MYLFLFLTFHWLMFCPKTPVRLKPSLVVVPVSEDI